METINDKLFYRDEHQNCFLYDSGDDPIIERIDKKRGDILHIKEHHNRVLFILKGKINFLHHNTSRVFEMSTFILLPRGCEYEMNIEEDVFLILLRLHHKINFCEHFPLEMLYQLNSTLTNKHPDIYPLKTKKIISGFLDSVMATISEGLKCKYFHEIKQRELYYYLRAYYSKDDLVAFFLPILNSDTDFAEKIYQKYESAKNIADLANYTHYSVSGFKKRFIKVFGTTPHDWIEKEKAKKIHYEINCTQKPFKEIASQYNFYSSSHFNRFCNKMYGMSPAILRKQTICNIIR